MATGIASMFYLISTIFIELCFHIDIQLLGLILIEQIAIVIFTGVISFFFRKTLLLDLENQIDGSDLATKVTGL